MEKVEKTRKEYPESKEKGESSYKIEPMEFFLFSFCQRFLILLSRRPGVYGLQSFERKKEITPGPLNGHLSGSESNINL